MVCLTWRNEAHPLVALEQDIPTGRLAGASTGGGGRRRHLLMEGEVHVMEEEGYHPLVEQGICWWHLEEEEGMSSCGGARVSTCGFGGWGVCCWMWKGWGSHYMEGVGYLLWLWWLGRAVLFQHEKKT